MISDGQLKKFQKICRDRFGREISREEALESGTKLLRLIELVYRPMTKEEFGKLQKRRKETGDM